VLRPSYDLLPEGPAPDSQWLALLELSSTFVYALEALGVVGLDPDFKAQPIEELSTRLSNSDVAVNIENDFKPSVKDEPTTNNTDPFLVDWNRHEDPENPKKRPKLKQTLVFGQIIPYLSYIRRKLHLCSRSCRNRGRVNVSHVLATLNLSMYVLGYGNWCNGILSSV
jgi:hypothetical protein